MSKGKRYNGTGNKLNVKKVFAVVIAILAIIMFILILVRLMKPTKSSTEKNIAMAYYAAFDNDKWGVINSSGETVINPSYDEMIIIPNKEKPVFIVMYDVDYSNNTYKTKAINEKNEQLFSGYEQVEAIQNYDKQNNLWYEKSCLRVKKGDKYGLIDFSGKVLLDCDYDSIEPIIGINNSLVTVKDGKMGLVSATGSAIIENEYEQITALTSKYEDGYIVKSSEGKFGIIGTNKKMTLPIDYEEIKHVYSENTYVAKENGIWKIINTTNNSSDDLKYDDVKSIDLTYMTVEKDGKYGIALTTGEEKIAPQYDSLKNIYQNYYIAKKDNLYGVIDTDNTIKIDFKYKNLVYIKEANIIEGDSEKIETDLFDKNFSLKLSGIVSEINTDKGYMKVRVNFDYKYYNFKFEEKKNTEILTNNTLFLSKKDGKYGYVDKNNVVVVNYIYDDATEQNDSGYVAVKKDGKWGTINSKGETVVEPSLELINNPIIDFIGKWHLAEDINANYYIK
ncbi:MAG: WG repeat-containing protein [Clostridia bacterium]